MLEYSVSKDSAFCFPCRLFATPGDSRSPFIKGGVAGWGNFKSKMVTHCRTPAHNNAQHAQHDLLPRKSLGLVLTACLEINTLLTERNVKKTESK